MEKNKTADYINFIVEDKFDPNEINWSYIKQESKDQIESSIKDIEDYIASNKDFDNYTAEERDQKYDELLAKYDALKDQIKNTVYTYKQKGFEFNFIKEVVNDFSVYDAGTVFIGIHLYATLFNRYPGKVQPNTDLNLELIGGEPIILYELLTKYTVTGIKEKTFIYASTIRKLSECSKIYNHYDNRSGFLFKKIQEWNLGLNKDLIDQFQKNIVTQMGADELAKQGIRVGSEKQEEPALKMADGQPLKIVKSIESAQ